MIECRQNEIGNIYKEYKESKKLFDEMSNKWNPDSEQDIDQDIENDYYDKEGRFQQLLDELELLHKVKTDDIVLDTTTHNSMVDDVNDLFKKHGVLFRLNSNIIETNYSLNHNDQEMYSEPRAVELSLIKSKQVILLGEKDRQEIKASQSDDASLLSLTSAWVRNLLWGKIRSKKNHQVELVVKDNDWDNRSSSQTSVFGSRLNDISGRPLFFFWITFKKKNRGSIRLPVAQRGSGLSSSRSQSRHSVHSRLRQLEWEK